MTIYEDDDEQKDETAQEFRMEIREITKEAMRKFEEMMTRKFNELEEQIEDYHRLPITSKQQDDNKTDPTMQDLQKEKDKKTIYNNKIQDNTDEDGDGSGEDGDDNKDGDDDDNNDDRDDDGDGDDDKDEDGDDDEDDDSDNGNDNRKKKKEKMDDNKTTGSQHEKQQQKSRTDVYSTEQR